MPAPPANKYHKVRIHLPPQRPRILPPQRPQPPAPQAPRVFTIGASAPAPSSRKCPECSTLATEMVPRRPGYITRILSFLWALTPTPRTLRPEPSVQVSESYLSSRCSQITMEIGPDQLISSFIPTLMQCVDYITPMLSFLAVRFIRIITPILQYFEPPRRDVEWLIFCAWTGPLSKTPQERYKQRRRTSFALERIRRRVLVVLLVSLGFRDIVEETMGLFAGI